MESGCKVRLSLIRMVVGLLGALLAILLFVDINLSFDQAHKESSQTMGTTSGLPRPIGDRLEVYLTEGAKLPGLADALEAALMASELPFTEVVLVDQLPVEAGGNPVLAVRVETNRGFWTPVFASRQMKVRFLYSQGMKPDQAAVLGTKAEPGAVVFGPDCTGACARGEREVTLQARSTGLLSLPHMRAYVAGQLVGEAVTLVKAGLPAHLNPERWLERASDLMRKQEAGKQGLWSTLQPMPGCKGGVLTFGAMGTDGEWGLWYYDAASDALTERLTQVELEAQAATALGLTSVRFVGSPAVGGDGQRFSLLLSTLNHGSLTATGTAGKCGLSELTFSRP